ncbi:MAG: hypothetical protein KAG62_18615 [Caulobacter sp.]|jgi:hypothetical protein|nr:hypothetical protein [Caulobacter sp.]
MPQGKDPKTADRLGGVHKVATPRQPVPASPGDEREVRLQDTRPKPPRRV